MKKLSSLILLLVFALGCELNKPKPVDLGPQATSATISKAIYSAIKDGDPLTIKPQDACLYEVNYRVDLQTGFKKVSEQTQEVLTTENVKNEDQIDVYRVTSKEVTTSYNGDKVDVVTRESVVDYPRFSAEKIQLSPMTLVSNLLKPQTKKTTYHNLVTKKIKFKSPRCYDYPNCELNATQIDYDEVNWTSDTEWKKMAVQLILTTETPYIATVLSYCEGQFIQLSGNQHYVNQCQNLRDFIFGQ